MDTSLRKIGLFLAFILIASLAIGLPCKAASTCGTKAHDYNKGPFSFTACEIAHPDNCNEFTFSDCALCRSELGEFFHHHTKPCTRTKCGIDGPGIAELEGLSIPGDCEDEGLKHGWYHYMSGTLVKDKSLKACRALSHHCFNYGSDTEKGFTLP